MADWSALPGELLRSISLILNAVDLLRFRSVCTTWCSAVPLPPLVPYPASRYPPLPCLGTSVETSGRLSLIKRTIYSAQSPSPSEPSWIFKLGQDNSGHMHFSDQHTDFLPIKTWAPNFPEAFISMIMSSRVRELNEEYTIQLHNSLSSEVVEMSHRGKVVVLNGLDNDFVIFTIQGFLENLCVYRSGDEEWRVVPDNTEQWTRCDDIILIGGKFYAIYQSGELATVNHMDLSVRIVASKKTESHKKFLVEYNGDLLLVELYIRIYKDTSGEDEEYHIGPLTDDMDLAVEVEVSRLDENAGKWVEVKDLGNMVMFLGPFCSFSASAEEIFGESSCHQGNCIFFTDEFDLGYGRFDGVPSDSCVQIWSPPDWVYSTTLPADGHVGEE